MKQNINQKLIALTFSLAMTSTTFAQVLDKQVSDKGIGVEAVVDAVNSLPSDLRVPARYALIIGASDYADDRIPDLPACANDARGLYDVLTNPTIGMFPKEHVMLLVDADVTEDAVVDAIDQLGRRVGPEDLVLVFFSGHGAVDSRGRSYWVMQDTRVDKLRATALPENEITDLLGDIKTTRLVTMIDACYSASTANLGDSKSILDLKNIFPEFDGKGRIAMTASAGDQLSVVIPEGEPGYGYSAFAYHLIQGLGGKADGAGGQSKEGVITVDELWSYVKDRTETTARRAGGEQQPQLKGSFGSRFMLTVNGERLVAMSSLVKTRLATLKSLFIDDGITADQYSQGKKLLGQRTLDLSETDQKTQTVYVDLVEGRLATSYLEVALAKNMPVPTPQIVPTSEELEIQVNTDNHLLNFEQTIEELIRVIEENKLLSKSSRGDVQLLQKYTSLPRDIFIRSVNGTGQTPLHIAAKYNATQPIGKLIAAGADINAEAKGDSSSLQNRISWAISGQDLRGPSPLDIAVINNAPDSTRVLLELGATSLLSINTNDTILHLAAEKNSANAMHVLTQHGQKKYLGATNAMGYTPFHNAIIHNSIDVIEVLLESGVDVNQRATVGRSDYPLHIATRNLREEILSLLLETGKANINAQNADGNTPLYVAAYYNRDKIVTMLLESGADATIKGMGNRTPLSRAKKLGNRNAIAALKAAGVTK